MSAHQLLTPYNYSPGDISRIKYIVIHYVGAAGGARANCLYYAGRYIGASAHYFVDFDGEVWQSVEDRNIAWHCGTKGTYYHPECRNSNSIGIELCIRNKGNKLDTSRDWYFEDATVDAAIRLTKELMQQYHIPASHVIRHYDVTHKICPNPYVYNHTKHTWNAFKAALEEHSSPEPTEELTTYAVATGADGLTVSVAGTLNVRSYPKTGSIIGTLKYGTHVYPSKKTFIDGNVWYYLPEMKGWICANYIDGGWVYESSIPSPRRWWFIHQNYTCTTQNIEIIGGKIYKFDQEGYLIENTSGTYIINGDGELLFN